MKYLFLVNPCAGSGKGQHVWRTIQQLLPQTGIDHEKVESTHPGHPRELAQWQAARRTDIDCLIVIRGDGTLHEVIAGLIASHRQPALPVAYIPAGTGNDFARGYGISTQPRQALRQILDNDHQHIINVGRFTDQATKQSGIFINN